MPPVDYKRLASEWRIMLDWCESGQKESLKKACHDHDKTYKNCIGHNKILRTHEDKAEQVRLCRKKVAEYEEKDDKKSSGGSVAHDNSEEVSNLKKRVATLLERNERLEERYSDIMDAVTDVTNILTADIAEETKEAEETEKKAVEDDSASESDSDRCSDEVRMNGLDFITMAEEYVERNDKLFNDQSAELVKEREAKRKALATVVKQTNAMKMLEEQLAKVTTERDALSKAIDEAGHAAVKKSEEVLAETDDSAEESESDSDDE
jgi:hypothetical protein